MTKCLGVGWGIQRVNDKYKISGVFMMGLYRYSLPVHCAFTDKTTFAWNKKDNAIVNLPQCTYSFTVRLCSAFTSSPWLQDLSLRLVIFKHSHYLLWSGMLAKCALWLATGHPATFHTAHPDRLNNCGQYPDLTALKTDVNCSLLTFKVG